MKKQLLEFSYKRNLGHIASALSMVDYLQSVFKVINRDDKIVIGKPFGAQAYYVIWKELGWLDDIDRLHMGIKHDEIDFVDYSEETMGNALGVAAGIAMTTDKRVWVNISDAALQMGNTLEAIQFIGHNKINNIFVTVDYNGSQVTGKVDDIISVEPCIDLCRHYGWWTQVVDGHNTAALDAAFNNLVDVIPNIVFCKTQKGHGVTEMQEQPELWHYKKIENEQTLDRLCNN